MFSCSLGALGRCPPAGLGPLPRELGLSWQSDIPLAAVEPLGDVHLPAGNRPKLQSDILSTAEEAGEAPTTTAVMTSHDLEKSDQVIGFRATSKMSHASSEKLGILTCRYKQLELLLKYGKPGPRYEDKSMGLGRGAI
ncbi:hypothetical protein MDA_GLEAN10025762 [Myotis davidii]|uniref:Uncharacterized protein n=1 Tax=Myotis davidii TaxID=225400 RepID=L5LSD3_MYODS|nr:hypothetical protein MDA_GLEAN10025762 [Myotis davidii]